MSTENSGSENISASAEEEKKPRWTLESAKEYQREWRRKFRSGLTGPKFVYANDEERKAGRRKSHNEAARRYRLKKKGLTSSIPCS